MASFKQQDLLGDGDQINEVKGMSQRQGWETSTADLAGLSLPHSERPLHSRGPAGWLGQVPTASASIRGGVAPQSRSGCCDQDKGQLDRQNNRCLLPQLHTAFPVRGIWGMGRGGRGPHSGPCSRKEKTAAEGESSVETGAQNQR